MSKIILPRRRFLAGLATALAAPAIIPVERLMKLPRPAALIIPPMLAFKAGDVISCVVDMTRKQVWWRKPHGHWHETKMREDGRFFPESSDLVITYNPGERPPPAGFENWKA